MSDGLLLRWEIDPSTLANNVGDWWERAQKAVLELASFFAARMESYAKANARWQDRTGNARQGLFARALPIAAGVIIVLAGSADYQIFLETKNAGRYQIILPTMEAHHGQIMSAIQSLVGG